MLFPHNMQKSSMWLRCYSSIHSFAGMSIIAVFKLGPMDRFQRVHELGWKKTATFNNR